MFLEGHIVELGIGEWNDGVAIQLTDTRQIAITGLTHDELRQLGGMLYQRITIRIQSEDDRARYRDEQGTESRQSNYDDETGIKKTGEI